MSNIWFTSDPHYMHRNIAGPKVSAWKAGYRNFDNETQMSAHIVKVWNQTVAEDDILWCLGDWAFQGLENIWNFRKQLRCKNIHLILGNHDHHIADNKILPNCHSIFTDQATAMIIIDGKNPTPFKDGRDDFLAVTAKELFSSVDHVADLKFGNTNIFVSHYAHRVWNGSHKGILHLYGHSHNSIPEYGKSMDVGIDSAKFLLGEYRPFSLEEVIGRLSKKEIEFPDHHDINTNIR